MAHRKAGKRLRFGLLGRVTLALFAVGLLPLGIASYRLVALNRESMSIQILRTHAVAARTSAVRVSAFIESLRGTIDALTHNPEFYRDPVSQTAQGLLAGLLQGQPIVVGVVVEDAEGAELLRVQDRNFATLVDRALDVAGSTWPAHLNARGGLWLRLDAPLPDEAGTIRVVADARTLGDVAQADELGEDAALTLASRDGGVVAGAGGLANLESFPPELVAAARTRRLSGASRFGSGDDAVLGAYAPVTGTDWFAMSYQPAEQAELAAREAQLQSLWAIAGSLALTGVITGIAYRSVVKPLRDLVRAQGRVAGVGAASDGDELQQLQESFAALERQLDDRAQLDKVFLGRYQVIAAIAEGGMGAVFKGRDPKLKRDVALKTIRVSGETLAARAGKIQQLLHEAVTIARFSHPNIVSVFDVEDAPERAFIAMEFVDGLSLERYLAQEGALTSKQVVPLGLGIARGLAAAHEHAVIHNDVKPANILLGYQGSIKVTDFGIAGAITAETKEDIVFGTPGFVPPETIRGQGYDMRGDLFALGAVLYECLTGRPAFRGRTTRKVLIDTLTREVEPPSRVHLDVPKELDAIVLSLLNRDPERRPESAGVVVEKLRRLAVARDWHWSPPLHDDDVRWSKLSTTRLQPLATRSDVVLDASRKLEKRAS